MSKGRKGITIAVTDMACAWLAKYMFSCYKEVGLVRRGRRRADIVALNMKRLIVIVEVKSCWQDFSSDKKWVEYLPFCDKFYFAVPEGFPVEKMNLPKEVGLLQDGKCVKKASIVKAVHSKRDLITRLAWHGGVSRKTI